MRPLRDGEEPLLESTAGRTMELVLEQPEVESTDDVDPTHWRSVPGATVEPPRLDGADVAGAESEAGEVDSRLKRKRATSDDGRGTSKWVSSLSRLLAIPLRPVTACCIVTTPGTSPLTADDFIKEGSGDVHVVNAQARVYSKDAEIHAAEEHKTTILLAGGFRQESGGALEKQGRRSYANISIEYDRGLYPHMLSLLAERRWLIKTMVCSLAAMSALESQEGQAVPLSDVVEVPGYNDNAYEELVAAMETMKLLELPHIAQLERDQDYPIDRTWRNCGIYLPCPRDILNPFALEKEIPLKESLEAHAIRLAKKKGVKGKAILCGVVQRTSPCSEGSTKIRLATVSPKDSELLGKLEEAGDAAYQVGSSEQSRCHNI
ncbi:hypothetical protein Tco_1283920 [Tanacetum coccineum]